MCTILLHAFVYDLKELRKLCIKTLFSNFSQQHMNAQFMFELVFGLSLVH